MPATEGPLRSTPAWLLRAHTWSPLRQLRIRGPAGTRPVWLKLEMFNPSGSVKYRTALSLLAALDREDPLLPGMTIVESTSGNLGVALSHLLAERGCQYVAVVDPKLSAAARSAMTDARAHVVTVEERDQHNGFLLTRLRMVRELCASLPSARWTNQYERIANPAVHRDVTGPEIVQQTGEELDMVLVAVSTGGTLAGISEHVRGAAPRAQIVAVDVAGSMATPGESRPHLLTGIGASRRSSFLRPHHYDRVARVPDIAALAACRLLEQDTGLALGGSSGAVLAAFLTDPECRWAPPRCPVLFCPDGGGSYRDTIYSDSWLASHGAHSMVSAAMTRARRDGLGFELGPESGNVAA